MIRKRRKTNKRRLLASTARGKSKLHRQYKNILAVSFAPLFLMFCVLFYLGFLTFFAYKSAVGSSFFDVRAIVVNGVNRAPVKKIEKIVSMNSEHTGVWKADINLIKSEIEKLKFVKTASVSKVLPNKFRIIVNERVPKAMVRINEKDFWVDKEALVLGLIPVSEKGRGFKMLGWEKSNLESAVENNKKRINLFTELQTEWEKNKLASRVKAIDLSDLRDPKAIVSDSGETVAIHLGRENFGWRLQKGLENIAGRGKEVRSIIVGGSRPVIRYRTFKIQDIY